jgi:hypothetical protein
MLWPKRTAVTPSTEFAPVRTTSHPYLTAKRRVQARQHLQAAQNFRIKRGDGQQRHDEPVSKMKWSKHQDVRGVYKVVSNLPASLVICERKANSIPSQFVRPQLLVGKTDRPLKLAEIYRLVTPVGEALRQFDFSPPVRFCPLTLAKNILNYTCSGQEFGLIAFLKSLIILTSIFPQYANIDSKSVYIHPFFSNIFFESSKYRSGEFMHKFQ